MTMTDKEYADAVMEIASQQNGAFTPFILPNEDGDCVEFFVAPNNYYSHRIDDYLTLYLDEESDEVVGFVVKNITRILNRVAEHKAAYSFVVNDGEIRLEALFTAMFSEDERRLTYIHEYQRVVDIAKAHQIDKARIPSMLEKSHTPISRETVSA